METPPVTAVGETSETCTRRFRDRSLPAIALALLVMLLFAFWAMVDADPILEPGRANVGGAGGIPSGSESSGDGSGAAAAGSGTGVASLDPDEKPLGDADTINNQAQEIASGNDAPETVRVLPRIGFTPPEDQPVKAPPIAPIAAAPGGQGRGGSPGRSGGSGTSFMGIETNAQRVCYVLDFSGSMFGMGGNYPKMDHLMLELKKSINRLEGDHSFYIIFFDDQPLPMGGTAMQLATSQNKSRWFAWADTESGGPSSRGGTDPSDAMAIALRDIRPDSIFLLSDGMFDSGRVFGVLGALNADHRVQVNTIGFHDRGNEAEMRRIASENRGEYRYVAPRILTPPAPPAAIP
ncbi:MAG: VWA domain-containing protein [Phycisphaerales bacterium]|nr:VWA domain-containing protein [Phycisphaerales bacterium]